MYEIHLTRESVLEALENAVSQKPVGYAYVNPLGEKAEAGDSVTCYYVDVHNNTPSCLVGTALWYMGVSLNDLIEQEGETAQSILPRLRISFEPGAEVLLQVAQNAQDSGTTWSGALGRAKRYAREYVS